MSDDARMLICFGIVMLICGAMLFGAGWFAAVGVYWAAAICGFLGVAWTAFTAFAFMMVFG